MFDSIARCQGHGRRRAGTSETVQELRSLDQLIENTATVVLLQLLLLLVVVVGLALERLRELEVG